MSDLSSPSEILENFQTNDEVVRWSLEPELQAISDNPAVIYRDNLAENMFDMPVEDIINIYLGMNIEGMSELVDLANDYVLDEPLSGIGIEMGAGTGLMAATICKSPAVVGLLAVELCAQMAELIIPKVCRHVLGDEVNRVVPVVGSFNNIPLEPESVDFILEIGSFHHSDDLDLTFRSSYEVLKPGGRLLCFDRCMPDSMTDQEVERRMNMQYSVNFLRSHGYPPDIALTRRENGEHDYRFFEWRRAIESAGFKLENIKKLVPISFRSAVKDALNTLPPFVLPKRVRHSGYRKNEDHPGFATLYAWLRDCMNLKGNRDKPWAIIKSPKEYTVFLLTK
jgi:SAM-dependent methyltransferase